MSRFKNLEFESQPLGEWQGQTAIKDKAHYLAQAEEAWIRGEFEQALRHYAKTLEFDPLEATAWIGQVRMLIELGEPHEASLWASKALEQFPRHSELLAAKAVAEARSGNLEEALALSDLAMEERGENFHLWLARGDVLLARRETRADYCFDKALAMKPGSWVAHWLAARIHFYYERIALALKYAQQAIALDASRAMGWLQLALCQQALGLAAQARNSLEQAQQLQPDSLSIAQALRNPPQSQAAEWGKRVRAWWHRLLAR